MNVTIIPQKLNGIIDAIPSKSHAHRVLIAQKLAQLQGQQRPDPLEIPSFSQDIIATKNCLAQLDKEFPYLDCKESGSTLRFMIPVAMALKESATFLGAGKLPYRPISPLKEEMEEHGCVFHMNDVNKNISDKYKEICTINGRLRPGHYRLAGNISSQFITGLLFALPLLSDDSTLELTTKLESAGYVDLSLDVLREFGIEIRQEHNENGFIVYHIPGNQIYCEPDGLTIEGDWSNACFWLAAGALNGNVTCRGLNMDSSQRDKEFVQILQDMGASITIEGDRRNASVTSQAMILDAAEVSVSQIPDVVPILAAVMALSDGASMITDAGRLKIKESDRLQTVYETLSRLGGDITYGGESLSITGLPSLEGGTVSSHNDHRIAMTAAIASCGCRNEVTIEHAEAVRKSYPNFFEDFTALGGKVTGL